MQLLLLLSALLSALTGAIGARVPEVRSHQVAMVRDSAPVVRSVVQLVRPLQGNPPLVAVAIIVPVAVPVLAAIFPLYAARRRE